MNRVNTSETDHKKTLLLEYETDIIIGVKWMEYFIYEIMVKFDILQNTFLCAY